MSNENNNGVIDFGGSTFVSENEGNATNPISQDSTSNVASNINVDDIFGSWDNSNTQSNATPVSNDYNNSNINFNSDNSKEEGKVTPPNVSDIFGTGASDSQVNDISTSSVSGEAMDNSELTKLAMDAFAGLTSNGVSLGSQDQENGSDSVSNVVSQTEVVTGILEPDASNPLKSENPTVSANPVNAPVQSEGESSVTSENPDYMAAFANPFANLKSNQDQVPQSPMETTPVNTETKDMNVQNPNQVVTDGAASLENVSGVVPVVGTDGSDLPSSSLENEESASSSNVIGDFNGFSDTGSNLENKGLENASSEENSPTANFETVSENNSMTSNLTNANSLDAVPTFDNQPNGEFNTVPPVASTVDNQAMSNIPDGFNNQFATQSPEVGALNPLNTQTEANAQIQAAPVSNAGVLDNQVAVSVSANTESAAPSFDSTVAPDFNNGNLVNPDMGTFDSQSNVAPTVTPATVDIQPVSSDFSHPAPLENTVSSDFNTNNPSSSDFNGVTLENQGQPDFNNSNVSSFDNGNLVNPGMETFNPQGNGGQEEVPNGIEVQPVTNGNSQPTLLENTVNSDFNANNQVSTDFNTGFNQEINNQISNNSTLNNQVANTSDNGSGTLNNNSTTDNTVISPEANSNLQQALSTPTNNISLDNSISVGSIPNSQVVAPTVTESNQEGSQVPAKKQGKVSIPIVMLIIIIVFSVGIIVLRRNELMDFFQTLMKK